MIRINLDKIKEILIEISIDLNDKSNIINEGTCKD